MVLCARSCLNSGCDSRTFAPKTHSCSGGLGDETADAVSGSSRGARSVKGTIVRFTVNATTTDQDLEVEICKLMQVDTTTLSLFGMAASTYLKLPECVFNMSNVIEVLTLEGRFIIPGNSSILDPMARFPSTLTYMSIKSARFVLYGSTDSQPGNGQLAYAPDWNAIAARYTSVLTFSIIASGITSVPTILPHSVRALTLSGNLMTGSLPATMLSNLNATLIDSLSLDFSGNQISGSIPSNLFYNFLPAPSATGITLDNLRFYFSNNKLNGPLPSSAFSQFNIVRSFDLRLDNNELTGLVPAQLLYLKTLSATASVSVSLRNNQLSGELPEGLFTSMTPSSPSDLTLLLSNNTLTGGIGNTLLHFNGDCNLVGLYIDLRNNSLDGQLGDIGLNTQCFSLAELTLLFDNNRLTGGVPRLRMGSTVSLFSALVSLTHNNLTAPLPTDLLHGQNFTQTSIDVSYNQMTGNPFDFVSRLPSVAEVANLTLTANHNSFTGSVPYHLFANWTNPDSPTFATGVMALDFSFNSLGGTITPGFMGGLNYTSQLNITLNWSNNQLKGPFPDPMFTGDSHSAGLTHFRLDLSSNRITSLPSSLFPGGTPTPLLEFYLSVDSNAIVGPLSDNFFQFIPQSLNSLSIFASNNPIRDVIPSNFFLFPIQPVRPSVFFFMANSQLVGTLPKLYNGGPASLTLFLLNNTLEGSFNLTDLVSTPSSDASTLVVALGNNKLNGSFVFNNSLLPPALALTFSATSNNFTTLMLDRYSIFLLGGLDVSNNRYLTGTLPPNLFNSKLNSFFAYNTSINGTMPQPPTSGAVTLKTLRLGNTAIDFCAPADRSIFKAPSLVRCELYGSNAPNCKDLYPSNCIVALPPAPSFGCNPNTQPSLDFVCINNVWTYNSTITNATFVIPSGATETVVQGDVASSTIVFGSAGSTLNVTGCLNNLTLVTLELTPKEIEALTSKSILLLISYNGSNPSCNSLDSVQIALRPQGSTCRRVTAANSASNVGTLSAILSVNTSRCNTWWIILVSVVCGVIVVAVIIFILLVIFVPRVRLFIRPYSKKRPTNDHKVT